MIKTCAICGKEFKVANWNISKKYCSKKCHDLSQVKDKIIKKCQVCGKAFEVIPYRKNAKYCSRACYMEGRKGTKLGNEILLKENFAELNIKSNTYGIIKFLICLDDVERVKNYTWCLTRSRSSNFYAMTKDGDTTIKLHRYLTSCPKNMEVDHINHNTLDNRQENLRICTSIINKQNLGISSKQKNYKYIYTSKYHNGYNVWIQRNNIKFSKHCLTIQDALTVRNNFLKTNYKKLNITECTLNELLKQS